MSYINRDKNMGSTLVDLEATTKLRAHYELTNGGVKVYFKNLPETYFYFSTERIKNFRQFIDFDDYNEDEYIDAVSFFIASIFCERKDKDWPTHGNKFKLLKFIADEFLTENDNDKLLTKVFKELHHCGYV
jgi:hypothetical protein